jgi:hypothetical protein
MFARVALGLFGAVAFLGGVIDVLYGLVERAPWSVVLGAVIGTLLAFAIAYGALDHFPWERGAAWHRNDRHLDEGRHARS